jgi:LPXTG-motif cell wall-anchored protein
MWVNRLGRVAVAAGAAVVAGLAISSPASADTKIPINPGNVPTTASAYGTHDCDKNFGGGPYPDKDVWVFVLPANGGNAGDFVSVTATFGTNGTLTIPADGGAIVTGKGTSKAWITTPAGWTLTAASATITGDADKFNLTHTCPAGGNGAGGGGGKSKQHKESSESNESHSKTSESASGQVSSTGGLAVTGTATTNIALVGGALVAAGIVLLALRRRREKLVFSAEGEAAPAKDEDES